MFEFVLGNFRKWFIALLWITLIGFIFAGIILGFVASGYLLNFLFGNVLGGIIGAIIGAGLGLLIGAFIVIISGGLIATFLNIDEKITAIQKEINGLKNKS